MSTRWTVSHQRDRIVLYVIYLFFPFCHGIARKLDTRRTETRNTNAPLRRCLEIKTVPFREIIFFRFLVWFGFAQLRPSLEMNDVEPRKRAEWKGWRKGGRDGGREINKWWHWRFRLAEQVQSNYLTKFRIPHLFLSLLAQQSNVRVVSEQLQSSDGKLGSQLNQSVKHLSKCWDSGQFPSGSRAVPEQFSSRFRAVFERLECPSQKSLAKELESVSKTISEQYSCNWKVWQFTTVGTAVSIEIDLRAELNLIYLYEWWQETKTLSA